MCRDLAAALAALAFSVISAVLPAPAHAQNVTPGGVLKLTLVEDLPQGFAIHESSAPATVLPASPCFSNLVYFDPLKKTESVETVIGELAERWSWQDDDRSLVFFLRKGVKWHDGQPFSSRDVKFTFDMVREAADAQAKLRINPRKEWYANVTGWRPPMRIPWSSDWCGLSPPAVDAGVGFQPDLCGARAARQLPDRVCRDWPVQAQGVAPGRVRRIHEEHGLFHSRTALS